MASDTLNRLVVIFLETAELQTKRRQEIRMSFWKENVGQIITANGFKLLTNAGAISHKQMEEKANRLYLQFDHRRKQQEARKADLRDETELKSLEQKLKSRKSN